MRLSVSGPLIALLLLLGGHASAADMPLRVGLVSRTFYYVPFWAAEDLGFYRAEGLSVQLDVMADATAQVPALLGGKLDITVAPTEGIIADVEAGGPLRILAGNSGKLSHYVIAQSRFKRIEDLKGARIGVLSLTEGSRFHFQEIAEAHGLKYPGDYSFVTTGGAPDRNRLLLENRIDVGLQSIPWSYVAEDEGFTDLGEVAKAIPDWQFTTVNADGRWAAVHRDEVIRFLRATQRGVDWLYAHRPEASALAARRLGIEPRYAERAWDDFTSGGIITRDMSVNRPGLVKVVEVLRRAGVLKGGGAIDVDRYIDGTDLSDAEAVVFATGPFLKTPPETEALFDKLFARVAAHAGVRHRTVVFDDWKDVGAALLDGRADVAWMGGASRYAATRLAGGGPVLDTVLYDGAPTYRSILVARNGLTVGDVPTSLKGLSLQLTHRNSTTGWLVPFAWLTERGLNPTEAFVYRDGAQHRDNERAVAGGAVDLVSDSDNNRAAMIREGAIKAGDGRVVWTSPPVPLDPIEARADLAPALVERLRAAFAAVTPAEAADTMMPHYTGFAPAWDADYAAVVEEWRRFGRR